MKRDLPGSERSFGLSVGAVLCVLAAGLYWRHHPLRAEVVGAIGAALIVLGGVAPATLTWPRVRWWRGARVVGEFHAGLLLTLLFVVGFVPCGVGWGLPR